MKSVGQILKQARIRQKKTLEKIHQEIKISIKNLKALESDHYSSLPASTFVKGFIQTYANNLGLDEEKLIAIFRRDWQKKEKNKIVLSELKTPSWTPKITTIIIISIILTIFLSYLGLQIKKFFAPPKLKIEKPLENEKVIGKTTLIQGKTNQEASIYINDQLINVNNQGEFSYQLEIHPGKNTIIIKAVNRRHKETIIKRLITAVDKDN